MIKRIDPKLRVPDYNILIFKPCKNCETSCNWGIEFGEYPQFCSNNGKIWLNSEQA